MDIDPDNKVVQLCAQGMSFEGEGDIADAKKCFLNAWAESTTDMEKFTSAHYVARHQDSIAEKLKWDETALRFALKMEEATMQSYYPSLYLNIAKCHEDLCDHSSAREHYQKALEYSRFLSKDGYGDMIRSGILSGIERILPL